MKHTLFEGLYYHTKLWDFGERIAPYKVYGTEKSDWSLLEDALETMLL